VNASTGRVPTSTDSLVDALAARLRNVDLIAWARITERAEKLGLSFEDLRLLLALRIRNTDCTVSDLAQVSGLPLDAAYPAAHHLRGRGYLYEKQRRYSLSEEGRELVAMLDAAHRAGIEAFVDGLDPRERQQIEEALGVTRPE
jgi:DNA-binding MarR family transcriptional regulator